MKPFTTPEISPSGKKLLAFQREGFESWDVVEGSHFVAYAMPHGHSTEGAWELRLVRDDGAFIEFSSASTEVGDWKEVGSLNLLWSPYGKATTNPGAKLQTTAIPAFRVTRVEKLIYEDADVISECGVVFIAQHGTSDEVVIAAGVPPGSVSMMAPFAPAPFKPQFDLSLCRRQQL